MNILPQFKIDIQNGLIVPEKEHEYNVYLASLESKKDTSKHLYGYLLSIKPLRGLRTIEHNNFYWTVVNPILAYEMGSSSRYEAHKDLVMMMYPNGVTIEKKLPNGQVVKYNERKKTSEMNVKEFNEFVEWCKDFGSLEFDINWEEHIDHDNK